MRRVDLDHRHRHHVHGGIGPIAEDDLADRTGHGVDDHVVGPPLAQVLRCADDLEHDVGRGIDVDLSLDGSVLHGVLVPATFGCRSRYTRFGQHATFCCSSGPRSTSWSIPTPEGQALTVTPMPAASLRLRHSALDMRVVSTSVASAPERPDGGLVLGRVRERVPVEEPGCVLPGDLVDLVVGAAGVLQLLPGELGRLRPRRVGVRVVALPGDVVDADAVAQQQTRTGR